MWRFSCVLLCLLPALINGEGHYFISVPGFIAPNSDYNVAINVDTASKIKVGIQGGSFSEEKTVDVEPSTAQLVTFNIPSELENTNYTLKTEGLSGIEFVNSTNVLFQEPKNMVLMQTDKGIYKPGELVRFRILVLDSFTKPVQLDGDLNIEIHDADKNLIKQYKVNELTHGVHSDELQLSPEPVLGTWKISADYKGKKTSKSVKIEEYVLPRFDIKVEIPPITTRDDGKIRASVRSKYTFGKPVEGDLTVNLHSGAHYSWSPEPKKDSVLLETKTIPFAGKADVELDIPEKPASDNSSDTEYSDYNRYADYYYLEFILAEKFSGKTVNATRNVAVQVLNYAIRVEKVPQDFVPDELFEISISLKDLHGKPIQDTKNPVRVFSTQDYNPRFVPDADGPEKYFDENGLLTTMLKISEVENVTYHSIYVHYKNRNSYLTGLRNSKKYTTPAPYTPRVYPLSLNIETKNPSIDQDVEIKATAQKEMKNLIFQVTGKGKLLLSEYVEVPNTKQHVFKFKPTFEMLPSANILVYYIDGDDVISDETGIYFERKLNNSIKLSATPEAKPGEDASINVETDPNSYVGLLAVDQSVLMLAHGNDLSSSDVFYKFYDFVPYLPYGGVRYPGKRSGLKSLTNAHHDAAELNIAFHQTDRVSAELSPVGAAFAGGQAGTPVQESPGMKAVTIRKEFPETWLWDTFSTDQARNTTIMRKVPDTITSWKITGFSLSPDSGIGITEDATDLKVFQPFFASVSLPYSVKRGEVVTVPVSVFNYMKEPVDAEVTFLNANDEFDFTEQAEGSDTNVARVKRLSIPPETNEAVSFTIKPKKVGHTTLKVTATSSVAGDGVERLLLVEPEGVTQYKNKAIMVDLSDKSEQIDEVDIEIPEDVVPDSTHIEVSVVGDILGPVLYHLDDLVRKPYGCGEQNMGNLVPNILVLNYLEKTKQGTPEIISKAKRFVESGYQRQLTYKHKDGSFSSFGEKEEPTPGSVWLTAYVARFLRKATDYTQIDEEVIKNSLEFLAKNQQTNGSFADPGAYIIRRHNNVDDKGIPLTAFVLMAFLESKTQIPQHEEVINKALDYIVKNVNADSDLYSIALSAYVLQLADHSSQDSFRQMLEDRATLNNGRKRWTEKSDEGQNPWYYYSNFDVQTTGYGLLTLTKSESTSDLAPIVRWLVSQRNDYGGFGSTQSTVVGLQSLFKFAEKISTGGENAVDVSLDFGGESKKLSANRENGIVLQTHKLPASTRNVKITSTGRGSALVQVAYKYNINEPEKEPSFVLEPTVSEKSNANYLQLSVCTKFTPSEGEADTTGMAVMEISLPSGFTADKDSFKNIKLTERVKRVESKKGNTLIVIYFESLDKKEICPTIEAFKTHKVEEQKPASVEVYDYYDNSRSARKFYSAPQ